MKIVKEVHEVTVTVYDEAKGAKGKQLDQTKKTYTLEYLLEEPGTVCPDTVDQVRQG